MSNNNKTQVVQEAEKFGSPSDFQQYNPNFQNTTNMFRQNVGGSATGNMNEFFSQIAPQIPAFFTGQQSPLMQTLTDRAKTLSSQAGANVANQFSGLNAAYSSGANELMARAMAEPFADVQNQLGSQLIGQTGQTLNTGMGNFFGDLSGNKSALAALSGPQYYNPYTYQGEIRAAAPQGNWFTDLLKAGVQGATTGWFAGL